MAHPRNNCYNRNTTARFACTVELHVTVNYIKPFTVAQKCFTVNFYRRKEQIYLDLRSNFKKACSFSTDFYKSPIYLISQKYVQWELRGYMQTEGRTW